MVQYCRKCGKELEDDAEFCDGCGFKLNENTQKTSNVTSKLPLILAVIAMVISVGEGLSCPMLMGWDNILMAMVSGIIAGALGILLMEKYDEPLIAGVEFIAAALLIYMLIARFGEISAVLFIITAIATLYLKGYHAHDKKLWLVPVLTVVVIFLLLIANSAFYQMNAQNSVEVGNITQNIKNDGYGYYDGSVKGDIYVGTSFDYLEVTVDFYDAKGTIINSVIAWNDLNPTSEKTYEFDGMYFEKQAPSKAEIKVFDSSTSKTPLYDENITINAAGGV